jgi:transcriptional regulator GlxA family with amidase domain
MNRKQLRLLILLSLTMLRCATGQSSAAQTDASKQSPQRLKVAFAVTERFNLLDVAGAWEVFGSARQPIEGKRWEEGGEHFYDTYLVADSTEPLHGGGLLITPNYSFEKAPKPDIIVVVAQNGSPEKLNEWLKKQSADGATIMSICVGAVKLARLGMLDGKYATSHHDYIERYEQQFPKVHWVREVRYVRSGDKIFTSGGDGLSGVDLALHLVDLRFGRKVAQGIADYLERHGDEWKQSDLPPQK